VRSVEACYKKVDDLLDREAFDAEVDGIIEGSGDLFTKELAAAMIVDQLGRSEVRVPPLNMARPGVTTVVRGFIARVISVREFERDGRVQHVANVLLKDGKGQITMVLWDDHSSLVAQGTIEPGCWVRAANVSVRSTEYGLEAHAGRTSTVCVEEETSELEEERCAIFDVEWSDLGALKEGDFVSVRGEVVSKRGPRRFRRRDGSAGKVLNLTIFDGAAMAILVLWDDLAEDQGNTGVGDTVALLHGQVKVNRGALEVHSRRESLFQPEAREEE
jgi:ssDNA-binding replication factor A large subunit